MPPVKILFAAAVACALAYAIVQMPHVMFFGKPAPIFTQTHNR